MTHLNSTKLNNGASHYDALADLEQVKLMSIHIVSLLCASSQIFVEARGLMTNLVTAYIPIIPHRLFEFEKSPMRQSIRQRMRTFVSGCLTIKAKVLRIQKEHPGCSLMRPTVSRALEDFMNVHFHLHADNHRVGAYDTSRLISDLKESLTKFMIHSQEVSKKHRWRRRTAVIYLDLVVSAWTVGMGSRIVTYQDLVKHISWDINTSWEIRYYMPTEPGEGGRKISFHELDFVQLNVYCRDHDHIMVKAEVKPRPSQR